MCQTPWCLLSRYISLQPIQTQPGLEATPGSGVEHGMSPPDSMVNNNNEDIYARESKEVSKQQRLIFISVCSSAKSKRLSKKSKLNPILPPR